MIKNKIKTFLILIIVTFLALPINSLALESQNNLENKDTIKTSTVFDITITKPNGFLYIFDISLIPLPRMMPFDAVIIGPVTATVTSANTEIENVEFYVDNELQTSVTESPYTWFWNTPLSPPPIHTLKTIAYVNNDTSTAQVTVLYINPF